MFKSGSLFHSKMLSAIKVFLLLTLIIEIQSMFTSTSAVSRGRSQSMRTLSNRNGFTTNLKARSSSPLASEASASSKITLHPMDVDVKPVSSTATMDASKIVEKSLKASESDRLLEDTNIQPEPIITAEAQRVRNVDFDLREVSLPTDVEHFNPMRDGVYARVRRILLRHGAAIVSGGVIGGAIGVGGSAIVDHFVNNNITTTTPLQMITSEQTQADSDEITNSF